MKRVLSLLAACAVITTSFVGLVQTVYAEGHTVRIVVSDTDTDTQKTLKFYYEGTGEDGLLAFGANLSISEGGTINTFALSGVAPEIKGSSGLGNLWFAGKDGEGVSSSDGELATATVTVPTDKDTTVSLEVYQFVDSEDWEEYKDEVGTVSVTIPKKSASEPEEPEETYYNKGYVFTSSADAVAKTYTKLTINVIDTADENKPGYAEVDLTDKLPTVSGAGEFTLFIKNIPTEYEVTSVELD